MAVMRTMILSTACASAWAIAPPSLEAVDWRNIYHDPSGKYVMFGTHQESFKERVTATAWLRTEYKEPQMIAQARVQSILTRSEFDCLHRNMRDLLFMSFPESNLQGGERVTQNPDSSWKPIIPGSGYQAIITWACTQGVDSSAKVPSRQWIPILSAMLTPTVALLGLGIAWGQWRTNRNKLKLDLFDRRHAVYEASVQLINSILGSGKANSEDIFVFTSKTRSAGFLVGAGVMNYLDEALRARAVDLETLQAELPDLVGLERVENVKKQSELKKWFAGQYAVLESQFEDALTLRH
jgi:hypothetical protein